MYKIGSSKIYWFDLLWLTVLIGATVFSCLGIPSLCPPDEARYAEIPREMLAYHQFIIPHLNGLMYFEKPPMAYWLVAGFMKLFGYSEWAVRASVAVMGTLGCLATYITAGLLFNRRTGILSALILSSALLYFLMSHFNTTDMVVSSFITLSLYSFILALQCRDHQKRDYGLWLGYLFSGLAMMTKGLIGVAFPAMIIFIWIGWTKQWKLIPKMRLFSGALIILAINLPWLLLVAHRVPDFLYFYFIKQQFLRYTTDETEREMPLWFYLTTFTLGFFPWILYFPQALIHCIKQKSAQLSFFIIWPAFIFLFFAFSNSVLIPYLLPLIPPMAILTGKYLDAAWQNAITKTQKISLGFYSILNGAAGVGTLVFLHINKMPQNDLMSIIAALFLLAPILILILPKTIQNIFLVILIFTYLPLTLAWVIFPSLTQESIKPLALKIDTLLKQHPDAEIVNYKYHNQDLPYYTQHIVTMVDRIGELQFGYDHSPNAKQWMINSKTFLQQWNSARRLYVVMRMDRYPIFINALHLTFYPIQKTEKNILISNKP